MTDELRSCRIISSNSTNHTLVLDQVLPRSQFTKMGVEYVKIPSTYYNIYEDQQIEFLNSLSVLVGFIVPMGEYTDIEFLDYLVGQLTLLDPPATYSYIINNLNQAEISSNMGIFTITFQPLISKYLGLCYVETALISSGAPQTIITGYLDFIRTRTIFVKSDLIFLGENSMFSTSDSSLATASNSEIIVAVDVDTNVIYPVMGRSGTVQNKLRLRIFDEDDIEIDTNCHKWTIAILLEFYGYN